MSSRPMPTTLYRGPIISMKRGPITSHPKIDISPYIPARSGMNLQRRAHTKRSPSSSNSRLTPVTEVDEAELAEDDEPAPLMKPRRRPRPMPLIPSRSRPLTPLPILSETPDSTISFQEKVEHLQKTGIALSPSTLLDRRPSETVLDFPIPPTSSSSPTSSFLPATPPHQLSSPTPSNRSSSSLSYPSTPQQSDDEESDKSMLQFFVPEDIIPTEDMTFLDLSDTASISMSSPTFHPFRRTASSVSLRSFGLAQPDTNLETIYTLDSKRRSAAPVPINRPGLFKEIEALRAKLPEKPDEGWAEMLGEERVLSIVDTASGSSFDVPLVLGSFLSPPSAVEDGDGFDSDGEGIPIPSEWAESEHEDASASAALSSSEEEDSDVELIGPNRALDPLVSADSPRRRRKPVRPPRPDTPSVYSMASFSESSLSSLSRRLLHDQSSSVNDFPISPHEWNFPVSASSSTPGKLPSPQLHSRFSSSTLDSIPEPSSSTSSFFARLMITGRSKRTSTSSYREGSSMSPISSSPLPPSRQTSNSSSLSHNFRTMRKASYVPVSPTTSSFSFSSFSSSDRERDHMDDACSCASGDTTGSNGLRRPPIPIELFIRT